jgi:hypothetical protein
MNCKENRKLMNIAIKKDVIPVLRKMGFKGSFPHFRRKLKDKIDILGFQFSQYGQGFYIEIAVSPLNGVTYNSGSHFPPENIKYYQCIHRIRIGPSIFNYEDGNYGNVTAQIITSFNDAEKWWANNNK